MLSGPSLSGGGASARLQSSCVAPRQKVTIVDQSSRPVAEVHAFQQQPFPVGRNEFLSSGCHESRLSIAQGRGRQNQSENHPANRFPFPVLTSSSVRRLSSRLHWRIASPDAHRI